MGNRLISVAKILFPSNGDLGDQEKAIWQNDIIALLYSAPLTIIGLIWLVFVTDLILLKHQWFILLGTLVLVYIFRKYDFFAFTEIKTGLYADWGNSLDAIPTWSAALLLGPTALWPGLLLHIINYTFKWKENRATGMLLNRTRHYCMDIADQTLLPLLALSSYLWWGGSFPLAGLEISQILPAIYATFVWFLLSRLLWLPHFIRSFFRTSHSLTPEERTSSIKQIVKLYAITDLTPLFVAPFSVLTAGLYTQNGLGVYGFIMFGLVMIAGLANQLSKAAERSYHRSRELERLDLLGTAIINAPLDASTLPDLLKEYVPGMFPDSQVEIRIFPSQVLLPSSKEWPSIPESLWEWLRSLPNPEVGFYPRGVPWPWDDKPAASSLLVAPIFSIDTGVLIGGACVMVRWFPPKIIPYFLPALQSLATQVSSALHQADVYTRSLAHELVLQELSLAGEIQANLLPDQVPQIKGWQFAAALEPTRETSGDFYDWINLPDGKLGFVVADVADKGMGAALFMILSRTLIRSYALDHPSRPEAALRDVNQRILNETGADLFVTAFYGVLDPATGRLDYCNAGHIPPVWIDNQMHTYPLTRTGMALGVLSDVKWERATVILSPGDVILLFTDGITEAENREGKFYGNQPILDIAKNCKGLGAEEIKNAILENIHTFSEKAFLSDDITLMVIVREILADNL